MPQTTVIETSEFKAYDPRPKNCDPYGHNKYRHSQSPWEPNESDTRSTTGARLDLKFDLGETNYISKNFNYS